MRWTTPVLTLASFAALAGIVWHAEGSNLRDMLNITGSAAQDRAIPAATLVELCDPKLHEQLDWSFDQDMPEQSAVSPGATISVHAFLNDDEVSLGDAEAAIDSFQDRLASARTATMEVDGYVDHAPQHQGLNPQNVEPSWNNRYREFNYIPRMQRYSLTRLTQYGNVRPQNSRQYIYRTRLGQQQRVLNRLRANRDRHLGRRAVNR